MCAGTTQSLNFIIGKITDLQKSQGTKKARTNKNQKLYNLKQKINTDGKNLVHYKKNKKADEHPHSLRFSSFTLSSTDVSPNHKHNLTNRGRRKIQERKKKIIPAQDEENKPTSLIHWT